MKLTSAASLLLSFALGVQSVHIDIPSIDHVVANVLEKFEHYVQYEGNHTSASLEKRATPYWYETIAHQGISAFGPSGYAVYRSVKDYGAKGKSTFT